MSNDNETNFQSGLQTYFKGVKSEWGKITWPEKSQIFGETFAVIVIVFFFTTAVYLMDIFFKYVFDLLAKQVG